MNLRDEINLRNLSFAASRKLLHERSDGSCPAVIYGRDEHGRHGNFHPTVDTAICANPVWARRLDKVHTASRRTRLRANWQWKELDTASSSDALLMNIFCHPEVMACSSVCSMLGVKRNAMLHFGFKPRIPLQSGAVDATEIDLSIDTLLIEAKLTESNFQCAKPSLVARYRDIESVFHLTELPQRNGKHTGYQLIRNTLAAYALGLSFSVFCDARRPDLIEEWYRILSAVRSLDFCSRLKLLTWQELASTLPADLQDFLIIKYGIFPKN